MTARDDYPFPAAVADGRVNGGVYGRQETTAALDEIDRLRELVIKLAADDYGYRPEGPKTFALESLDRPLWFAMLRSYRALRGNRTFGYGVSRVLARQLTLTFFQEIDWVLYVGSK